MTVCSACLALVFAAIALFVSGCGQQASPASDSSRVESFPSPPPTAAGAAEDSAAKPQRLARDPAGLRNVIAVSAGLLSGSEPEGEEGFASLAKLGVRTIVSVDGARPDVEAAHRNGLRYVHIPIGYDGVPEQAAVALARAVRQPARPIYVHCHHGKHRGPAAAAIACIAAGKADGKSALEILRLAGTGKEYPGLWRDVERYQPPPPDSPLPDLVEVAVVGSLAAAMAGVDRQWDNVKLCRDADWLTPRNHPDLAPLQQALLLREALHEAGRTIPADRFDEQFRSWLAEAVALAAQLETNVKKENRPEAAESFNRLDQACQRCHARYRN